MTHEMHLQPKYYDFIKSGTKRIELRLYDKKRQQIELGDKIKFIKNDEDFCYTRVIGLLRYETFDDLFADHDAFILGDQTLEKRELLDALNKIYPPEKQAELGVIGLRVELAK